MTTRAAGDDDSSRAPGVSFDTSGGRGYRAQIGATAGVSGVSIRPRAIGIAMVSGALLALGATTAMGVPGHQVPATDLFSGHIARASGSFKPDHGRVTVALWTPMTDAVTRPVTVRIASWRCAGRKHCISPMGSLTGTITAGPRRIADVGSAFAINAAGNVRPLGHATAIGTAYGLGNVRQGVEQMTVTLTSRRGRIVIAAVTAVVPSFSHP